MASMKYVETNIEKWLEQIFQEQSFKHHEVKVSGGNEKGDGFLSDVAYVEVRGTTGANEEKSYNLVVKTEKTSRELREALPIRTAFENEIFFYEEVLPAYAKFQEEKGIRGPFNNAPKCYGTLLCDDTEILILENMKQHGYSVHGRYDPMDRGHVREVVKIYGKLHAISFALRQQRPEVFKKLAGNLKDFHKLVRENLKPPDDYNAYETIIKGAKNESNYEIVEKAHALNKKMRSGEELAHPSDPFAVILHGDCWNNNFMFKYESGPDTTITDVCLLDFQISRVGSPALDLSYFLFTCISEEDIQNFDEINNVYYESFSGFLLDLGENPNEIFPYEELMNQWKKYSAFGLFMLPSIIKICVTDKDDMVDLQEAAEDGKDFAKAFSTNIKDIHQYLKRTIPVMRLAIDKGLI